MSEAIKAPFGQEAITLGEQVRALRLSNGEPQRTFGRRMGYSKRSICKIEDGNLIDVPYFVKRIRKIEPEFAPDREATVYSEDDKWLHTINNVDTNKAIRLLSLAEGLSLPKFAADADIPDRTLTKQENDYGYFASTVDNIIKASVLEENGHAAKLLRLKSQDVTPLSITGTDIEDSTYGSLVRYLRVSEGFTQKDVASSLYVSEDTVKEIEHDRIYPNKYTQRSLREFFGLRQDGPMHKLLAIKSGVSTEELTDSFLVSVYREGSLLLTERIPQKITYDNEALEEVMTLDTLPQKLKYVRTKAGISQKTLADRIPGKRKFTQGNIGGYETGKKHMETQTVVQVLYGLGYEIHDPIVWHMIDTVVEDQRKRRAQPKQIFPAPQETNA